LIKFKSISVITRAFSHFTMVLVEEYHGYAIVNRVIAITSNKVSSPSLLALPPEIRNEIFRILLETGSVFHPALAPLYRLEHIFEEFQGILQASAQNRREFSGYVLLTQ
jgi:hypothetical protein